LLFDEGERKCQKIPTKMARFSLKPIYWADHLVVAKARSQKSCRGALDSEQASPMDLPKGPQPTRN